MIKIVSKAFNEQAHDSTNIPDISHPIVLHKTKPTPLTRHYHPGLREYRLELNSMIHAKMVVFLRLLIASSRSVNS